MRPRSAARTCSSQRRTSPCPRGLAKRRPCIWSSHHRSPELDAAVDDRNSVWVVCSHIGRRKRKCKRRRPTPIARRDAAAILRRRPSLLMMLSTEHCGNEAFHSRGLSRIPIPTSYSDLITRTRPRLRRSRPGSASRAPTVRARTAHHPRTGRRRATLGAAASQKMLLPALPARTRRHPAAT